jgi:glyoxylase I family protein
VAIVSVHHLGLTVRDAEASAAWYERVLGFRRSGAFQAPDGARRKVFLHHDGLGIRLGLTQHAAGDGSPFDETRTGLDHLAFGVAGPAELERWAARLDELGVPRSPLAPANTMPGAAVLVFRDPDNIQLELISGGPAADGGGPAGS